MSGASGIPVKSIAGLDSPSLSAADNQNVSSVRVGLAWNADTTYSPSPVVLIGGRALLAVGAAMMMPATLSIIRLTFADERERAMAIGLWSAVASGGAAIGPLIGGVLLEYFWWGSVFLINVPVAVAALPPLLSSFPAARAEATWAGTCRVRC